MLKKIIYEISRRVRGRVEGVFIRFQDTEISDEKFLKHIDIPDGMNFKEYFRNRRVPSLLTDDIDSCSVDEIVKEADKVVEHKFDIFGSGETSLGDKINWHQDFISGYTWDKRKYFKSIEIPYGEGDIKVPWEISRSHHLVHLGIAYRITKNEKYVEEFISQINDWIDNNVPKHGVNWHCTMDVAIRVCNWIVAYTYFKDSGRLEEDFLKIFFKSVYIHGMHIQNNLETGEGILTNHYLADIAGLAIIGSLVPEFDLAEEWKMFGINELRKQMDEQVYEDGTVFEASTCYHVLSLEIFFYSTLAVVISDKRFSGDNYTEVAGKIFGEEYVEKMHKMFDALLHLVKPNGQIPQIGDNDSGRFIKICSKNSLDKRHILSLGTLFFKECIGDVNKTKSKLFANSGWYVNHDSGNYFLVSCGSNGQNGKGGHAHNDKLSFELHVDGKDIIVDPGTFNYTRYPDLRNLFRSTASHNTIVVDGEEINIFNDKKLFTNFDKVYADIEVWGETNGYAIFVGYHDGYRRLKEPVLHKREISLNKKKKVWIIKDMLLGRGTHTFDQFFHLAPDVQTQYLDEDFARSKMTEDVIKDIDKTVAGKRILPVLVKFADGKEFILMALDADDLILEVSDSWVSPEYGVKQDAPVLKFSKVAKCPTKFVTVVFGV